MKEPIFRYSMKAIIIKDNKLLVESCDYLRDLKNIKETIVLGDVN